MDRLCSLVVSAVFKLLLQLQAFLPAPYGTTTLVIYIMMLFVVLPKIRWLLVSPILVPCMDLAPVVSEANNIANPL